MDEQTKKMLAKARALALSYRDKELKRMDAGLPDDLANLDELKRAVARLIGGDKN